MSSMGAPSADAVSTGLPARRVVVGVDGSPASLAAIRAAEAAARAIGATVVAVTAYDRPPVYGAFPVVLPELEQDTRRRLDEAVLAALGDEPTTPVISGLRQGDAVHELVDESRGADLLVVGTRGRSGFAELVLGSVSTGCIAHAECPVLVVHEGAPAAPRPKEGRRVVVGVAVGRASVAALRFAQQAAARMDATLEVVTAWDYEGVSQVVKGEFEKAAVAAQARSLAEAFDDETPELSGRVMEGATASVLLAAARSADLLVLGRGRIGVVRAAVLGSVVLTCTAHSTCPVLVVPEGLAGEHPGDHLVRRARSRPT